MTGLYFMTEEAYRGGIGLYYIQREGYRSVLHDRGGVQVCIT